MGEDRVLSQFSALASVVFSMAFTIVFDGMIRRRRQRDRRISMLEAVLPAGGLIGEADDSIDRPPQAAGLGVSSAQEQLQSAASPQKLSRRANSMVRGSVAPVIWPNVELVTVLEMPV